MKRSLGETRPYFIFDITWISFVPTCCSLPRTCLELGCSLTLSGRKCDEWISCVRELIYKQPEILMSIHRFSKSAWQQARRFGMKPPLISDLGERVATSFSKDPAAATQQILQCLKPAERALLKEALSIEAEASLQTAKTFARHE